MAGDWMKIELELPDKPEVHAMAGILNIDPDAVVGKLIRVWQWFDKHTTDGNAYGVTYSLLDRITNVTGFSEAMVFVGWLEQKDKILHMPKFDRHTSQSAKTRASTAKRVAKSRNAETVTETLLEKRREENNITTLVVSETADPCPHKEIIALYHEHLPMMTRVVSWTKARASLLKSRWRDNPKYQTLDFWERMFKYVAKSDFLTGKDGKWQADLEWMLKEANFVKILEGKYENKGESNEH